MPHCNNLGGWAMNVALPSSLQGQRARSPKWYAVQIQPGKLKLAIMNLSRQHFLTFSPIVKRSCLRSGRAVEMKEPLFPGYLFVAFDSNWDAWRSINGTVGVARLVMFGDAPASLPQAFVESLLDSADDEDVVSFEDELKQGDKVRIVGGAFDNITGTLMSGDRHARVMILVELLSGPRRVSIDRNRLIAG